jgi:HD-GYP domain-containing protein (c-di-GMP phosphodiesterase class II)
VLERSVPSSYSVLARLAGVVEVKDRDTRGHNRRVADLCVKIGRLLGMPPARLDVLERSGLLHDVGKLGIPETILQKHNSLNDEEWALVKTHPELGSAILASAGGFTRELLGVLYHHERMDGSGYPRGLAREAIPIEARIVAVADTFDVLTSDRPYRKARGVHEARRVLREEAGRHLDPVVVAALLRALDLEIGDHDAAWRKGFRAATA